MVSFVFHRNTQTYERVELNIYQYDSTNSLATLNGESYVFLSNEEADSAVAIVKGLIQGSQKNQ